MLPRKQPSSKHPALGTVGDFIVGYAWEIVARRRLIPWFDRVDTKSNPVDGLSRGRMEGPWDNVVKGKFPEGLLQALRSANVTGE